MGDISECFNLLYHRHCWLSKTLYRAQTSSIYLKEHCLFVSPGDQNVSQFLCWMPTQVIYWLSQTGADHQANLQVVNTLLRGSTGEC